MEKELEAARKGTWNVGEAWQGCGCYCTLPSFNSVLGIFLFTLSRKEYSKLLKEITCNQYIYYILVKGVVKKNVISTAMSAEVVKSSKFEKECKEMKRKLEGIEETQEEKDKDQEKEKAKQCEYNSKKKQYHLEKDMGQHQF